jgi:ADP-heptose:LPS heptosyltransferase
MKEILLINLKRHGDIFAMGHLIRSLLANNSTAKISLLVFEEFKISAKNLKGISNIYTIDRQKILTYKKNRIFSDGFALNQFENELRPIVQGQWDIVYNYSNDRVSTHITSYLKSRTIKHQGIRFNELCNVEYSNEWAIVFNDIITELKYSPINFVDNYNMIAGTEADNSTFILKTKKEYNESAFRNFKDIRETAKDGGIKVIGIQLTASHQNKTLNNETLIELIDHLYVSERYFPVLLIAPTERERELVSTINSEFNNSLISIEADFLALSSVMMNLDLLITPDTSVKHVADLCKTPTVEISLGESPLFKQAITNEDSVIITPLVTTRSFVKAEVDGSLELSNQNNLIKADDILQAVEYILEGDEIYNLSNGLTIYQPTKDELGTRYSYLAGNYDDIAEIERLMSRSYLMKRFDIADVHGILSEVTILDRRYIKYWVESRKQDMTDLSKALLSTLRALLQNDQSTRSTQLFLKNLTNLCSFCDIESEFMRIPLLRFRARLEAVNSSNVQQSAKEVEQLLYELKADFQHQVDLVKMLQAEVQTDSGLFRKDLAERVQHEQ